MGPAAQRGGAGECPAGHGPGGGAALDRLARHVEELLALRAEEASVAKAEKELLEAQLDFARRELGVQRRLLRQLLERVHGAELREGEVCTAALEPWDDHPMVGL